MLSPFSFLCDFCWHYKSSTVWQAFLGSFIFGALCEVNVLRNELNKPICAEKGDHKSHWPFTGGCWGLWKNLLKWRRYFSSFLGVGRGDKGQLLNGEVELSKFSASTFWIIINAQQQLSMKIEVEGIKKVHVKGMKTSDNSALNFTHKILCL